MGLEEGKRLQDGDCKFPLQMKKTTRTTSFGYSMFKRSKSYSHNRENWDLSPQDFARHNFDTILKESKKNVKCQQTLNNEVESSLKQEIVHLEKRLSGQFAVRRALEEALGYKSAPVDALNSFLMPKHTKELIKEISVLEMEVMYLEQHLLTLYRKVFDEQFSPTPSSLPREDDLNPSQTCKSQLIREVCEVNYPFKREKGNVQDKTSDRVMLRWNLTFDLSNEDSVGCSDERLAEGSGVHRSYSALSQRSLCSLTSTQTQGEKIDRALRSCHSQPLSSLENSALPAISLAEYLGTSIVDHVVPEPLDKLSEDLLRCICSIYTKVMDPPLIHPGLSFSTSSCSSTSPLSPRYLGDSPGCKKGSLSAGLENPYRLEGLRDSCGPYSEIVEVQSISTDDDKLRSVEDMLREFRLLEQRLEKVDVKRMKHEEKLAFWINIHNALIMNAYLECGIPQNYLKRSSLLLKAACNVGGRMITAETIQNSILGCTTHRPGQWLRTLLSPKSKSRAGELQSYAMEHPGALLHFALCSGNQSDPAVRLYTPEKVQQQLETAKEEYIRATISIRKEQKIMLPKVLESFAKEMNLSSIELVDQIQQYLPETLRMAIKRCQTGKSHKCVEWVPHNFTFRYLLSRDLACYC